MACGAEILVDDEDFERISAHQWHLSHNGYPSRRVRQPDGRKVVIYLHHEVTARMAGRDIDHADGNKLNARRANLRDASRTLNNANSKPRVGCSSRFKGVAWVKSYGRWWAYINQGGRRTHIGYFTDETEAARAYNAAAIATFGEFARPNQLQ